LIGGTLALFFWRTNFNISAAVGYIAVFGVSVLNGVVLLSSIRQARQEGCSPRDAIARGCEIRFRPIVVSAVVAVIGFLPAALSQGIGAEIQRPLARVVIAGPIPAPAGAGGKPDRRRLPSSPRRQGRAVHRTARRPQPRPTPSLTRFTANGRAPLSAARPILKRRRARPPSAGRRGKRCAHDRSYRRV